MAWTIRDGWVRLPSLERDIPGLFWGVTTRALGDMKDPARFARAFLGAGLDSGRAAGGRQVHGRRVRWAVEPTPFLGSAATDGVATDRPGLPLRVYAADCAPVLLADGKSRAIAVVHAGWRGAQKGVLASAFKLLAKRGVRPRDLRMAVGPHIQNCCYEVGEEVAAAFRAHPRAFKRTAPGHYLFSLARVLKDQALRAGVPARAVHIAPYCTHSDPRFFSYRRDKTEERLAAVAALARRSAPKK